MTLSIKNVIKKILSSCGWEIKLIKTTEDQCILLSNALRIKNIEIVFDVGANIGQFALPHKLRIGQTSRYFVA